MKNSSIATKLRTKTAQEKKIITNRPTLRAYIAIKGILSTAYRIKGNVNSVRYWKPTLKAGKPVDKCVLLGAKNLKQN